MTQIAPATLIAIQSYSAPAAPRPAAPGTFEPLSAADLAPRRHGGQGDAPVRLSTEALTLLGDSNPRQDAPPQRAPATPRASAGAWRTEPPGSRLDITV
jgi:hypothetical protein